MEKNGELFIQGRWRELSERLRQKIHTSAEKGDSAQLISDLSSYGCCLLLLSKHNDVKDVYRFLITEYEAQMLLEKEKASISRFLALYSVFQGNIGLAKYYYEESRRNFQMIESFEEEAMMLMEACNWLYFLINDLEGIFYSVERLKVMNRTTNNKIKEFENLVCENSIVKGDFGNFNDVFWDLLSLHLNSFDKQNKDYLFLSIPSLLVNLIQASNQDDHEKTERIAYSLLAQLDQFKHPWYRAIGYLIISKIISEKALLKKSRKLFSSMNLTKSIKYFNEKQLFSEIPASLLPSSNISHQLIKEKLSFQLFHNFSITFQNKELNLNGWERKTAEELFVYLLIQPNLEVYRDVIIEEFFPHDSTKKATNKLYVNVHAINKTFKQVMYREETLVSISKGKVKICSTLLEEVDIQNYLKLYSVGQKLWRYDKEAAVELFEKALDIYDTCFVPHLIYIPWLDQFRETIKKKHLQILRYLFSYYKQPEKVEWVLKELVECDRLDESTTKEYMLFLKGQGRYIEAKELYLNFKQLLKEEMDIEVTKELHKLISENS